MSYHYHYSVEDLENLIPFERDLYVEMVKKNIEEQQKENN